MRRTPLLLIGVFTLVLSACDEGTEPSGSQTTTPVAASGSGSTEAAPATPPTEELDGIWVGPLYEMRNGTTYRLRLTIKQCDLGAECGRLRVTTLNWSRSSGISRGCAGTLSYKGTEGDTFVFRENMASGTCASALMYLTPLPSGHAFAVEEYWENSYGSVGYLLPEYYMPVGS